MSECTVRIGIGLIGPGFVGRALLRQIAEQAQTLLATQQVDLQVLGITNTKKMLLSDTGIDLHNWTEAWESKEQIVPADLESFFSHVAGCDGFHKVIMDCTASDTVPLEYKNWVLSGGHIIAANKKMGAGPLHRYEEMRNCCKKSGASFPYEATVGAGMPIISTLKGMLDTGDRVHRIEGILSGTLSYILNSLSDPCTTFSSVVVQARQQGFSEPDPREDLSGADVVRKLVVLARDCGVMLSAEDVKVESLIPSELKDITSVAQFLELLPQFDGVMQSKLDAARAAGGVLRCVGVLDVQQGSCEVALKRYPLDHPFAGVRGTDNIVQFTTSRYSPRPLVIQGPGAGPEVTAMANSVYAEICKSQQFSANFQTC